MRPASAEPSRQKGQYQSQDERDALLEARYAYDRQGAASTLAFVSQNADAVVEQFFQWRRGQHFEQPFGEAIVSFERARFGADLYPAAHGLLRFAIRLKLAPEDGGRVLPRRAPSLPAVAPTSSARRLLASEMEMPRPRLSAAEYERRQAELLEQRRQLEMDAPRDAGEDAE